MGIILMLLVIMLICIAVLTFGALFGSILFFCLPFKGKNYTRVNGFVENILVPRDGSRNYKYVFNYMANQQICRGFLILNNCKLTRGDKFPLFYNKLNPSMIKSAKKHWIFIVLGIGCILFIPIGLMCLYSIWGGLVEIMSYPI